MDPITLLSLGLGLGQTAFGAIQDAKAKKIAEMNVRPRYEIPDEYSKNEATYEDLAQNGFSSDILTRMHQNELRGLSSSLASGLQMGADANTVNDYYQTYLNGQSNVDVQNAVQKFSNINMNANAREQMAQQKFIQFGYNQDAPYKDKAQLAAAQQQQGVSNIFGGASTAVNAVAGDQSRKLYTARTAAIEKSFDTTPHPVVDSGSNIGYNPPVNGLDVAMNYLHSQGLTTPSANPGASREGAAFYLDQLAKNNIFAFQH